MTVQRARDPAWPSGIDHAARLCRSWIELRGNDPMLRAGLARIGRRRVVLVATASDERGQRRHLTVGAFDLARRAIQLAGRLGVPLLTLVDTPGADPSAASEASGIAHAIAETFATMASLSVPTVSVCVGEGGSGGALALAAADRLLALEHAIFTVITPEGAAAILRAGSDAVARIAAQLHLTAADLVDLGIADGVVADDGTALARAIDDAFEHAVVGDRQRRLERASARVLD